MTVRHIGPSFLGIASFAFLTGCTHTPPKPPGPPEAKAGGFSSVATSVAGKPAVSPALDSDGDGIPDDRERALGSNPYASDTDTDGFDDGLEDMLSGFGFDLLKPSRDADGDGLEDGFEREIGTNPENPDSEGDGWSDFDEVLNRFFGYDPLVATADLDFDGLTDELEARIKSSPNATDSNGDGIDDFPTYSAGLDPAGPRIEGGRGEIIGSTYSPAMRETLRTIRAGKPFPEALAGELPYARVTRALVGAGRVKPSAALMQQSVYNPHNSPGIYPSYNQIVSELFATAAQFDGTSGPALVRLFQWSVSTVEEQEKRGRIIYAMKISDNPHKNEPEPEVLFMGLHHGRELITATITMDLIKT